MGLAFALLILTVVLTTCRTAPARPEPGGSPPPGLFITANPLDLSAVTEVSKFRSCSGHDYSGRNVAGEIETERSMKHYVHTALDWSGSGQLKGFAPFDGIVVSIQPEQFPMGQQMRIASTTAPGWTFIFFHADPLVAVGQRVKAGETVAAWPPADISRVRLDQLPPGVLVRHRVGEGGHLRLAACPHGAGRRSGLRATWFWTADAGDLQGPARRRPLSRLQLGSGR